MIAFLSIPPYYLEEITGLDRRTIQDYKTVADRVSAGRHVDLGFSHHREVAKLPEEKQIVRKLSLFIASNLSGNNNI